ncbi:zinc-binding alcohol dehydrogenase family protein [Radiobacillus sp. PE A8.2]|uniref:zinc-binding alcohol dehydrogenase family protein n=1 Tax=Radiobacillus sp. PE A8.2 TaxID=3380349 RepID=UPI0038902936
MKSIVCEQPKKFEMKEVNTPHALEKEVLIKIKRIGICGTDLHAYNGNQPFFTYPRVLGHELAGTVEELGKGVTGWSKGDQVTVIPYLNCGKCIACRHEKTNCCENMQVIGVHKDGGMCEYLSVPETNLLSTKGLSLEQTALVEPLSISAHAVRRANISENETVVVIGCGPIGLGVMRIAKLMGARVISMDVNDDRLRVSREWAKVDDTINVLEDGLDQLSQITKSELATKVFDATGNQLSMNQSFKYVSHGGTLVFVGLMNKDITFFDPDFHKKEITLLASRNANQQDFKYTIEKMRTGEITINGFHTHHCSFDEMLEQFPNWLNPEEKVIKAIVEL